MKRIISSPQRVGPVLTSVAGSRSGHPASRWRRIVAGFAAGIAIAAGAGLAAESNQLPGPASGQEHRLADVTTYTGTLPDGAAWLLEAPRAWNGTVLLFAHGLVPPGQPNPAVNASDPVTAAFLLDAGYALAGTSFATTGWAVEDALRDHADLLQIVAGTIGRPRLTIAWGASLGGLVTAALAERASGHIDGALSLCGVLAGGVAGWNSFLDVLFTVKTLIAPDAPIELTNITDPFGSLQAAVDALNAAQRTPEGRARIALAAAIGGIPGWTRADQPEPGPHDFETREINQFEILRSLTVLLGIALRSDVEARAGGNPSFNTKVDYAALLRDSSGRREVLALYRQAGLRLGDDLSRLQAAPRIHADPAARRYLTKFASPSGRLRVPVLTIHNIADPLAPVEHEQAFADAVHRAGARPLLRQAFVGRAGHCIFTPAETVTALQVVIERVETGRWRGRNRADTLNVRASSLGPELNAHLDDETGQPVPTDPAFLEFEPGPYPRSFVTPLR